MTERTLLAIGDPERASATVTNLDLNKLIETRLLIQANSGGGKSYAIRYLLEQTYGKVQHIVIDREGEFSTLRAVTPRLTDLLVGRDGDVAADSGTAKLLARKVLELGLSTVVDLSEMSPGQQREYVRVFIDSLNHAPRALWKDCLIIIDEAHIFAPESGKGASEATESIALLLSTGRKRGFCPVLATQRLAKLNKDVAAECLNKLIGRTSNEDVKRAGEELAQGKQSSIQLRGLEPGHFWAYGPAIAPEPVLVCTGKVKTAPPARGAERSTPPAAPEEIRAALAKELAELPKQAADEAGNLESLQQQVRNLTRELTHVKRGQPEPERINVPVRDERAIAVAVFDATHQLRMMHDLALRDIYERVHTGMESSLGLIEQAQKSNWPPGSTEPQPTKAEWLRTQVMMPPRHHKKPDLLQRAARDVELTPVDRIRRPVGNGDLPRGALKMLDVLARNPNRVLTKAQLGTLSGFAASGGTFGEYLRQLRRAGLVESDVTDGGLILSQSGLQKVGGWKPQQTNDGIFREWCDALPQGPRKMLEVLRQWPGGLTLARLGSESGYTASAGTFGEYLRQLKRNGLVKVEHGSAKLVAELAP